MRILFLILLIAFLFIQNKFKKINFYKVSLVLYFIFLSLRYGQGTDYFNYYFPYYKEIPLTLIATKSFVNGQFEILYTLMVSLFRSFNFSFEFLIIVISFIDILLVNEFLKKFSSNKLLSLIIIYLVYGIVFFESTLRQSVAMSIILGVCFVALADNNIKKFLTGTVIAFFFHRSSIFISLWLCLLYFIEKKYGYKKIRQYVMFNYKKIILLLLIFFIIINTLPFDVLFSVVPGVLGKKLIIYFSENSLSIISLSIRFLYLAMILFFVSNKSFKFDKNRFLVIYSYLFGLIVYILLCRFSIISRMTVYFEILEVVIYSFILTDKTLIKGMFKKTMIMIYCCSICVLFFKDGMVTQKQSNYKDVSVIYPYYNVFNKNRAKKNIMMSKYDKKLGEKKDYETK